MRPWNLDPLNWGAGQYRDVPISKWVEKARKRHTQDLLKSITDSSYPFYYDEDEAQRAVWFIETQLKHSKGKQFAGKPFLLEAWQELDIIKPLFGWKRRSDDTRRYRKFFIFIPRKNGKSTLMAAIGLYMLCCDCEPGAEVYCAATKEKQAKIVWTEAKRMVKKSPMLSEEVRCLSNVLECEELESTMSPLGRDSDTEDGLNVHAGLIDEYHAHKTDEMLGVLETATGSRDQPMIGIITTAGFKFVCPCKDEYDYALKLLEGDLINEEYFVYVTTVDDPEKWDQPEEWYKANPQLGLTIKEEFMQAACNEAKQKPSKKNQVLVKHLNIWSSGKSSWMDMSMFSKCGEPIDWEQFKGAECYAALDQGRTRDLTALALAFLRRDNGEDQPPNVYLKMFYWMPQDQDLVEKSREDEANYNLWIEQGFITATPGGTTRTDIVHRDIMELASIYKFQPGFAVDALSASELVQDLNDSGLEVFKHSQTMPAMRFPVDSFEELVISGRLKHGDNPVLKYNVANSITIRDGNGNIKIMKNESRHRVDGAVAGCMAVGRALIAPAKKKSAYQTRGLRTI